MIIKNDINTIQLQSINTYNVASTSTGQLLVKSQYINYINVINLRTITNDLTTKIESLYCNSVYDTTTANTYYAGYYWLNTAGVFTKVDLISTDVDIIKLPNFSVQTITNATKTIIFATPIKIDIGTYFNVNSAYETGTATSFNGYRLVVATVVDERTITVTQDLTNFNTYVSGGIANMIENADGRSLSKKTVYQQYLQFSTTISDLLKGNANNSVLSITMMGT